MSNRNDELQWDDADEQAALEAAESSSAASSDQELPEEVAAPATPGRATKRKPPVLAIGLGITALLVIAGASAFLLRPAPEPTAQQSGVPDVPSDLIGLPGESPVIAAAPTDPLTGELINQPPANQGPVTTPAQPPVAPNKNTPNKAATPKQPATPAKIPGAAQPGSAGTNVPANIPGAPITAAQPSGNGVIPNQIINPPNLPGLPVGQNTPSSGMNLNVSNVEKTLSTNKSPFRNYEPKSESNSGRSPNTTDNAVPSRLPSTPAAVIRMAPPVTPTAPITAPITAPVPAPSAPTVIRTSPPRVSTMPPISVPVPVPSAPMARPTLPGAPGTNQANQPKPVQDIPTPANPKVTVIKTPPALNALEKSVTDLELSYASLQESAGETVVTLGSRYGYVNVPVGELIPGTTLRLSQATPDEAVLTMNAMQVKLPLGGTR